MDDIGERFESFVVGEYGDMIWGEKVFEKVVKFCGRCRRRFGAAVQVGPYETHQAVRDGDVKILFLFLWRV